MGMTAHLLDDTFITAKELAKGPEIGGWKAILEKNICTNPLKKVQSSHPVTSMKDRSKYLPHPLQMDSTQQEKAGKGN